MSKAGQSTQKGIFAQNWAAMSLFLQFLRDSNFSYIQLEPERSEDFDLVFKDGKKIICESKYRAKKFNRSELKEVLSSVLQRRSLEQKDEILIVCKNLDENLESEIRNTRFFRNLKIKFKKAGFTEEMIDLFPRLDFWIFKGAIDKNLNYSLVADLLNIWLPPEDVIRFTDSILQNKISRKATSGSAYSRQDFNKDAQALKVEVQERSDYFNMKSEKDKQFLTLETDVNGNKGIEWGTGSVSAFSTRWDLMAFAMDRLQTRYDLDLKKWDSFWHLNKMPFSFRIFEIFKNNSQTEDNKKYILDYIKKYTKTIRGFYRSDYFDVEVVKVVAKIIDESGDKYLQEAFLILKDLITFSGKELLYLKDTGHDHDQWEKEQVCGLLQKLYLQADSALQQKVVDLLFSTFDITEDDGEFDWHAPKQVYEIIREWLERDFIKRFDIVVSKITRQYSNYYEKFGTKLQFAGWEHIGGGAAFWGHNYHVGDRHFIGGILAPAIRNFYEKNEKDGWEFVKTHCISKVREVSKERPDFLNRCVYGIILERYSSTEKKLSEEAFKILSEFILSRKGIPHKSALIYQAAVNAILSDEKKWRLVEITIKKYKVPVNPFAEQIVRDLAKKKHTAAVATLKGWFSDPEYYKRVHFEHDPVSNIQGLLETDLDLAIGLFKDLITSEYVVKRQSDRFSAYPVAALLNDIVKLNYGKGLEIIRFLENIDTLSEDQQIIYTFSLFQYKNNDDSDDFKLLLKIYADVVDPFLSSHEDNIESICERLTVANCREALVQFASRLAVKKEMARALRIVKVFINDPDPYLPGKDPHDPKDEYNEQLKIEKGEAPHSITSVRGWCGWTLMKCSVLEGREEVPEIINLTQRLILDENYYVIHMGTFALAQLVRNRLTVLPSDREILFFNDNKEVALQMARKVETIVFDLLDRLLNWPEKVQIAMAESVLHVFEPMRALNEKDAYRFVTTIAKLPLKAIQDAALLLIYFAEFRKDAYVNWKFSLPGLYDDLGPDRYDANKFRRVLLETIKKIQETKPDECFPFAAQIEKAMREVTSLKNGDANHVNKMALGYFDLFTDVYAHNIYNLVYRIVQDKFFAGGNYLEEWFNLLLKCFKVEAIYFQTQIDAGNIQQIYWYPSLYHSSILELVYDKLGKERFMEAAQIYFSLPNEIELHESERLISIVQTIAKDDPNATKIVSSLIERNPSKYWHLRKKVLDKSEE